MKRKLTLDYFYRGEIEVAAPRNGKPGYRWVAGYSRGYGGAVDYPWQTKRACQAEARDHGCVAVFVRQEAL